MSTMCADQRLAEVNRRIAAAEERFLKLEEELASGAHPDLTMMLIQATALTLNMLRETGRRLEQRSSSRLH